MCETDPSMDALVEKELYRLTDDIVSELRSRYARHGMEYATEKMHGDTPVNACMTLDNLKECREELIDAIFNLLVYLFREPDEVKRWHYGQEPLGQVIQAYRAVTSAP